MPRKYRFALIALGLCLLSAPIAVSGQVEDGDGDKHGEEIVIITSDGEHLSLSVEEGPRIRVVSDGDDAEVIEIDLSDIGEMIHDAMASVDDALDEIADVQIDMKLGRENSLTIFDGEDEVMIDVGQIMADVGEALQEAFEELEEEFEDADDDYHGYRRQHLESEFTDREDAQLRRQLRDLKDEVADLKAELRRLERRQRH